MDPAYVFGVMVGKEKPQEVRYPPAGRSILAFARRKRTRNQREKGAIDERVAVNQEKPRAVWTVHELNIKRLRPQLGTKASCVELALDTYLWRRALIARNSASLALTSFHVPVSS